MTIEIDLSAAQISAILDENAKAAGTMREAARRTLDVASEFVFFAAFDGTNNDKDDLKGERQCTNVGQLWDQYKLAMGGNRNLGGQYYPGLGTKGQPKKETWLPAAVTEQVRATAAKACRDLALQAADWLVDHPFGVVRVALAAFSRGTASAAVFCQMLRRDGVRAPTAVIAPGKVALAAGVLFDPVATGVAGNLAFPPDVDNLVGIRSLNEYRTLFRAVDYTRQKDLVTCVGMYGNHCDIGGGYDNGLGALSLEAATAFLRAAGLPVTEVPAARRFRRDQVALHSEEYEQINNTRNQLWDVDNEDGFSFADKRHFDDKVVVAPASNAPASGARRFTLYDGTQIEV